MTVTHERLLELLDYERETGLFRWKVRAAICLRIGDVAGRTQPRGGYRQIKINFKAYLAHRLAWFYVYGEWPAQQIDHINGNRDDNRISNLRDVSASVNTMNRHTPNQNGTTGLTGVYLKRGRFGARIRICGRSMYLGVYATPEEAHSVYCEAKSQYLARGSKLTIVEEFQARAIA